MALDAITISLLSNELNSNLDNSRIDKIHQPSKDEIVLHLRKRDGNLKLLISARSGSARICLTKEVFENPKTPPSFCMLLRKYLGGARFISSNFIKGERIIMLSFLATSEIGDLVNIDMAIELMGRYANIVLINDEGKIIDAMKRVDADASSIRQLLPGIIYKLPPNRENPRLIEETKEVIKKVVSYEGLVADSFMKNTQGLGAVIAREISHIASLETVYADSLDISQKMKLDFATEKVVNYYNNPVFTTVFDENEKPIEFSFMPLTQYGDLKQVHYKTLSELLDEYYAKKDKQERLRQKGKDLYRLVSNLLERNIRKSNLRREDLIKSENSEPLKIKGELLTANLYKLEKGMSSVKVLNYYDNTEITIKLDPRLTGNENAQKYFKDYKKKQTAVKILKNLIIQDEIEFEYLKSIEYAISNADNEQELMNIRNELYTARYIKYFKTKTKKEKPQDFIKYVSSDGFLILVGRNNLQNDKLTMKTARGKDLWFHTKNAPGSHVVIMSEGKDIPLKTQNEAAMLAVFHSSQKESSKVAVDYTFVKNIKKTNDLKPGMVIYDTNETAYVTPELDVINNLERL